MESSEMDCRKNNGCFIFYLFLLLYFFVMVVVWMECNFELEVPEQSAKDNKEAVLMLSDK
jgi:hypothetical protein